GAALNRRLRPPGLAAQPGRGSRRRRSPAPGGGAAQHDDQRDRGQPPPAVRRARAVLRGTGGCLEASGAHRVPFSRRPEHPRSQTHLGLYYGRRSREFGLERQNSVFRRLVTTCAVVLGAALVATGCSPVKFGAAAVVGDQRITIATLDTEEIGRAHV